MPNPKLSVWCGELRAAERFEMGAILSIARPRTFALEVRPGAERGATAAEDDAAHVRRRLHLLDARPQACMASQRATTTARHGQTEIGASAACAGSQP